MIGLLKKKMRLMRELKKIDRNLKNDVKLQP